MSCILVGASPKARLILDFLTDERRADEIAGFVDCDAAKKGQIFCGKPILGDLPFVLEQRLHHQHSFCVSLSERRFSERDEYFRYLRRHNANLASIISRRSLVSSSAEISSGSVIFPGAMINAGAKIGACVTIYTGALIDHDCTIADNVEISPRVAIAGGVCVGTTSFLGMNATILPRLKIRAGAVVGAGAVVTSDVASGDVVAGNPARLLRRAVA